LSLRNYIAKRAVASIITLFFIFLVNFFLIYLRVPENQGTPLDVLFSQYLRFVFLEGFGPALKNSQISTLEFILRRVPYTLLLLGVSSF